jgi:hypothetical protein
VQNQAMRARATGLVLVDHDVDGLPAELGGKAANATGKVFKCYKMDMLAMCSMVESPVHSSKPCNTSCPELHISKLATTAQRS